MSRGWHQELTLSVQRWHLFSKFFSSSWFPTYVKLTTILQSHESKLFYSDTEAYKRHLSIFLRHSHCHYPSTSLSIQSTMTCPQFISYIRTPVILLFPQNSYELLVPTQGKCHSIIDSLLSNLWPQTAFTVSKVSIIHYFTVAQSNHLSSEFLFCSCAFLC